MFKQTSIGKKLGFGFGALLMIITGLGIYSLRQMDHINQVSTDMKENWLPSVRYAEEINTNTSDFRLNELSHIASTTDEAMKMYEAEMNSVLGKMKENQKKYEPLISSDEERKLYESFKSEWESYMQVHQKAFDLSVANKNAEALALVLGEAAKKFTVASDIMVKIVDMNVKGGDAASDEGQQRLRNQPLLLKKRWLLSKS